MYINGKKIKEFSYPNSIWKTYTMDIHQVHPLNVPEVCLLYVQLSSEKIKANFFIIFLLLAMTYIICPSLIIVQEKNTGRQHTNNNINFNVYSSVKDI